MAHDSLAISTTVFGPEIAKDDLQRFLETIREAGFSAVELSRKHRDIARRADRIKASGLKVWSVHGALDGGAVSSETFVRRAAVTREIARMEDTAMFAPCPYVIHYLDRFKDPVFGENFRRSVEELHACSSRLGFDLTVETAPYKPGHDERYPDSREIAGFVRSFDAPDLNVTIDVNHSNLREDLPTVCRNCLGLISNVHVSDNHGEWEDHLPPGEGEIDLPGAFAALRRNGYEGPCNLEFHLPNQPDVDVLRGIRLRTLAMLSVPSGL